jgi:hypothetical protein
MKNDLKLRVHFSKDKKGCLSVVRWQLFLKSRRENFRLNGVIEQVSDKEGFSPSPV